MARLHTLTLLIMGTDGVHTTFVFSGLNHSSTIPKFCSGGLKDVSRHIWLSANFFAHSALRSFWLPKQMSLVTHNGIHKPTF